MKTYIMQLLGVVMVSIVSCTSLSDGGSADMAPHPDHEKRVRLQHTGQNNMYLMRERMERQSSEINRKRNIEEAGSGTDAPATVPPQLRPTRTPNAPIDSTRHNTGWPQQIRSPR